MKSAELTQFVVRERDLIFRRLSARGFALTGHAAGSLDPNLLIQDELITEKLAQIVAKCSEP